MITLSPTVIALPKEAMPYALFVRQLMVLAQQYMDVTIGATPTGEDRNKLTEINMALMTINQSLNNLRDAK